MRVRATLIVAQQDLRSSWQSDDYFRFFLTEDHRFPSSLISTKSENDTVKDLFEKYFNVYFDWANVQLSDFRRVSIEDCEVLYSCKIPAMLGVEKSGKFIPISKKDEIDIEEFYGRTIQRLFRSF
tara:strand:+ start:233 stop:607 length:375 start_codon:yes stop_codon:yes gene_type:complete